MQSTNPAQKPIQTVNPNNTPPKKNQKQQLPVTSMSNTQEEPETSDSRGTEAKRAENRTTPETPSTADTQITIPPEPGTNLSPRTRSLKTWLEHNISAIGSHCQTAFNALPEIYQSINPILILQAKIGSSSTLGTIRESSVEGWAQSGFQMNVISRGITAGDKKPIIQCLLHNEMGLASGVSGMTVLNTGLCFEPNGNEQYTAATTSFMTEEVHRIEHSGAMAEGGFYGINASLRGSVGADTVEHHYWDESSSRVAAGVAITTAQALGSGLGWIAGSLLDTASGPLGALNQASTPNIPTATSALPSTQNLASSVYQWADLGASLGGAFGAKSMLGLMKSTNALVPSKTLSMKEITVGVAECSFEIPLGNGENLYLMGFLRANSTSITLNTLSNSVLYPNPRETVSAHEHQETSEISEISETLESSKL